MRQAAGMFDTAGISNENDEWYTPPWLFEALGVTFDLDPCSPGSPSQATRPYRNPRRPRTRKPRLHPKRNIARRE